MKQVKFYLKNCISDKPISALKDRGSLHSESPEWAGQTFPERTVGGWGFSFTKSSELGNCCAGMLVPDYKGKENEIISYGLACNTGIRAKPCADVTVAFSKVSPDPGNS